MRKFYVRLKTNLAKTAGLTMLLTASVFAFAQPASYLTFNGTDQYMMIPHHDDFNITTSESFTLTGWVKIANYGSNDPRYISKRENGNASGDARTGYEYFGQSSTYKFGLNTPTNTSGHAYSTYTGVYVYPNTWMHFALVVDHDNDVIRIYQDGSNVNTSTNSTLVNNWYVNNTNNVYIGAGYNTGNVQYLLNGAMGNVRFYSKALSSSEISTDMSNVPIANLTQDMRDHLIAAYEMCTSNIHSGQISDLSGNGHTATVFGYTSADPEITGVTLTQQTGYTGRGNDNEVILKAAVAFGGTSDNVNLSKVKLNINGTSASDYDNIKVYSTGSSSTFSTSNCIGTVTPTSGDFDCALGGTLNSGTNYLWVTADVKATATEGNKIDASLVSITTAEQTYEVTSPSPSGDREILLARTTLYKPGDYFSQYWRIPAVITAKDGSIVAVTDKRKYSNGDLPADIDIVARRSTDGGHTWSAPVTVAQGTGYNQGYGDCALVLGDGAGEIIAGFVGGVGLWNGTNTKPLRHYISRSLDNGQTWSAPVDITDQLYGSGCSVSPNNTWHSSFFGSGNGLRTSSGRIMFVAAIRHTLNNGAGNSETLYNHAVYSDDNGVTWHVSGEASTGGDEAKVTQLNDGRILMSIRHSGNRWYNISSDNGETWGTTQSWSDLYNNNACNGDMIRYTSLSQGYEKNRLLHSFPDNSNGRRDVSVFVSYNEGESWPTKKCIVPYSSAYSSLCILPDGTIGLYVEEDSDGGDTYDCVFYNFSLSWMTNGADVYVPIGEMHGINYLTCEHGSVSGMAQAPENAIVTVTATPDSGYELGNIIVTKVAGGNVAVTGNQFTMPAEAVNVSATFVVNPIQTFLDEGFENNGTSLPVGWTQVYESGTHNWVVKSGIYSSHSATAHTGSYNASFTYVNKTDKTKLVTPVMDLSSCANATLTFWFIKPEWYGDNDQLRVYYRTSSTGSWTLIEGCEFTTGVSSWTKVEKSLPNLTETYQIAFEGYDGYGYGIGVDDVKIIGTVVPTYQISYTDDGNGTVTGPAKAAEGANVTLTVTPNHGYELNEITVTKVGGGDIEVVDNHFTMPAEAVNVSATFSVLTPVTLTITTFGQGTMTASPSPDVYAGDEVTLTATPAAGYMLGRLVVRKDATGEEITVTNNKFTMPAENVTAYASFYVGFEFFEDFETNPTTKGWTYASSGSGNWQWATGGYNSDKCMYCSYSNAYYSPYLISPALNLAGHEGLTMTFWRKQPNYSGRCEEINVIYTLDNGANWTLIENYNTIVANYTETTIAIPAAACANGVKFGFQAIYNDANSVYIDDVRIFKDIVLPSYSITPAITGSGTLSFSPEGNVEVGTTVTVTANGGTLTSLNYLREDGRIIDIDIENTPYTFTMPECNTTVTAVFEAAVPCTVTAHVNGVTFFTEDNAYVGGDFTLPETMTYDGYTFMGWNIDNPTPGSSVDIPASASTFKPTGDCDIYAVYGIAEIGDEYTLMSTPSFEDGMKYIISLYYDDYYAIDLTESTVGGNVTMTRVVEDSPGVITSTSMTDLALTAVYSNDYSGYCLTDGVNRVYDGYPYQVRAGAASTWNGDAYVIDTYETHTYIRSNQYNYGVHYWMSLYWSSSSPTGFNFGTNNYGGSELKIYKASMTYTYYTEFDAPIIGNTEIAGTASLSRAATIGSNGVLSFTGTFTNATASDLTIQDGGQLIINNSGVMATVEKNITAATSWTGNATDGWYTISSPINSNALDINSIDNFTDDNFDLYYYDEPNHLWINSDSGSAFSTLTDTRGYLYAASSPRTLGFTGELNNADINCSLSYTSTLDVPGLRGFNLIGNPFTQNITMSNISGAALPGGYVLTNAGAWKAEVDTEIKPCEGFLVQTNTATEITISKNATKSRDNHCYITANVRHGEHEDNAFAMFSTTTGLNKVSHRNGNIPMLYIPQDDAKFAIASMDETVTMFPLNFRAKTTGYYTISLKSSQIHEGFNDFDYLHLIDNMTGEDIDMLLEDSYSFIGSPRDNEDRFTVRLHRDGVAENDVEAESFVYQNGNSLVINGEGTFELIDMLGRVVISKEIHGETVSVDNLMTRAYIVRMIGDEVKTQKIVIR